MGAGSSNTTYQSSNYYIGGNNNSLLGGKESIGTASASATTDVSPKTDLNYSQQINPSWLGKLSGISKDAGKKLIGTVSNNPDIIQTFKHVGATALRVSMEDGDFKTKAKKLVNDLLDESTPEGLINASNQIDMNMIRDAANMQVDIVHKLPVAHDAYNTFALGQTGMRNNEVSTNITTQSLIALRDRATPTELAMEDQIIKVAGPRLGVMNKRSQDVPSDIIISTFDNAQTKYGKMQDVKNQASKMSADMAAIHFSTLHNKAAILSESGILSMGMWETNQFIGEIKQVTSPFTAASYPNGHYFTKQDLKRYANEFHDDTDNSIIHNFATTSYSYALPSEDSTRVTRLQLTGQVTIVNQPYNKTSSLKVGMIYQTKTGGYVFSPAVFIDTDVILSVDALSVPVTPPPQQGTVREKRSITPESSKLKGDNYEYTDVFEIAEDVFNRNRVKIDELEKGLLNTESPMSADSFDVDSSGQRVKRNTAKPATVEVHHKFSYSSQFQVVVNLTDAVAISPQTMFTPHYDDWINLSPLKAMLVVSYPENVSFSLSVQTPTLSIETISHPLHMRYIGKPYYGAVLDLLGEVPLWYSTSDIHDPTNIYYKQLETIFCRSAKIAEKHINSGAPYQLSVDHVIECRQTSNLPPLDEDGLRAHIYTLITELPRWLYSTGPIRPYSKLCRRRLFMRLCEVVSFQMLSHIDVYGSSKDNLITTYLSECNTYNAIEYKMDQKRQKKSGS